MSMKTPRLQSWQQPLLPDDAIVEILSWLPVKPLLRFRCVCRYWKSIISDPSFVKLHLQISPKNVNIILTSHDVEDEINILCCAVPCFVRSLFNNLSSTSYEEVCYPLEDRYFIIGSCNGLVCLAALPLSLWGNTIKETWFRFWNPATRIRSNKLPSLVTDLWTLSMDSTKLGFGYDHSSDTYKVVAILLDMKAEEDSQKTQVKVYNMGDTCWRDIGSFPAFPIPTFNTGAYVSGTLNWFALRNFSLGCEWHAVTIDRLVIISLDLGKETYRQLLLLDGLDEVPNTEPVLAVLVDCLCISFEYKGTHFVLWQMKEFGVEKSWTQFMNLSYHHLQIRDFLFEPEDRQLTHVQGKYILPGDLRLELICISENGHVVVLKNDEDLEVILYDRRDNRVERAKIPNNKIWTNCKGYIQSLVLPL